jgi:outer membrane immunogenic protein
MRKIIVLLLLMLSVSFTAKAQSFSKVDVFGGYSYTRASNNGTSSFGGNGGTVAVTYNVTNWIGIVGEFDVSHFSSVFHFSSSARTGNANTETYVFGPKLTLFRAHKVAPFAQVLVGGIHADNAFGNSFPTPGSETRLAIVGGGGVDWKIREYLSVRLVQLDYLYTHLQTDTNNHQNNLRYSTGVVFHF